MKTFQEYWSGLSPDEKEELAENAELRYTSISNIANGHRGTSLDAVARLMSADKRIKWQMFLKRD